MEKTLFAPAERVPEVQLRDLHQMLLGIPLFED